ncbi:MAG: TerB family tellurite resistance protein [Chitinophagaceae bacterium]
MNKWIAITLFLFCFHFSSAKAQSDEAQQLLLNWEKLAQFKKILNNMYDGYKILNTGYTTIKDISEGNFNLHKTFLDGLLQVSPSVKKYKRIADIISIQLRIVKEYKAAFNEFKQDRQFTAAEISYMGKVYSHLFKESLQYIDELAMVVTAGKLRMSDNERLEAIDRVYGHISDQLSFLKEFNNNTMILSLQRKKEQQEILLSKQLQGIK